MGVFRAFRLRAALKARVEAYCIPVPGRSSVLFTILPSWSAQVHLFPVFGEVCKEGRGRFRKKQEKMENACQAGFQDK